MEFHIIRDGIQIPVAGSKLMSQGKKSKYNFELVSGDKIIIPANNNTVKLIQVKFNKRVLLI